MALDTAPPPVTSPLTDLSIDPLTRKPVSSRTIARDWAQWLFSLVERINITARMLGTVSLATQSASLPGTPIPLPALSDGLYRVSYYARITRAASVSSSLTVSLSWTDGGVSVSYSGAAMTGNTTSTVQSGSVLIHADAATPINYATTYVSVGGTTMQYLLAITIESVLA